MVALLSGYASKLRGSSRPMSNASTMFGENLFCTFCILLIRRSRKKDPTDMGDSVKNNLTGLGHYIHRGRVYCWTYCISMCWATLVRDGHAVCEAAFRHALNSWESPDTLQRGCMWDSRCPSESLLPFSRGAGDPLEDSPCSSGDMDDISNMWQMLEYYY